MARIFVPFCIVLFFSHAETKSKAGKGLQLSEIKDCVLSKNNYDPVYVLPHMVKVTQANGVYSIVGNVSVPKRTPLVHYNMRSYKKADIKSPLLFDIKNLTCRSLIPIIAMKVLNLKWNPNTCVLLPGVYKITKPVTTDNIRKIAGSTTMTLETGIYEFDISTTNGMILCLHFLIK